MLRYALRRTLWAIPTLFGVSLIVFFVTTLIPDPAEGISLDYGAAILASDPSAFDALEEQRRGRFLDLPRFFNPEPGDVRSRAEAAVAHLVASDSEAPSAAHRLARLGGAALPYVLPKLDNLPPAARGRVAVALAPVAERMGLGSAEELHVPDQASLWQRYWEDRALDFTGPSVHRAVHRLVLRGTDLREQDLLQIDTFALGELLTAMAGATDREALARLAALASHVTGRAVEIPATADASFARRASADWQEWWYVHRTDYVPLAGAERMAATVAETRYGKWILRAASGQLGISTRDGEPILDKLRARAPVTLGLIGLAMLVSYALAIPLGVYSAIRRGKPADTGLAVLLFAMYSLPTFWAAELLVRAFAGSGAFGLMPGGGMESADVAAFATSFGLARVRDIAAHLVLPVAALTIGSLASLSRYQRASMLDVIAQDYIRTARAKGVPFLRLVVVHGLRNALMPTVTLAGLQLPALFGGAFIVEEVFGLPGVGYETLRAVEAHDTAWLTATILVMAIITTVGLIASDLAYGMLDPRVRDTMLRRERGVHT